MKFYNKIHEACPTALRHHLASKTFGFSPLLQPAPIPCLCYTPLKRRPGAAKGNPLMLETNSHCPCLASSGAPPSLPTAQDLVSACGAAERHGKADCSENMWLKEPRTERKSFLEEAERPKSRPWTRSHTEETIQPRLWQGEDFSTDCVSFWIFFKFVLQVYDQVKSSFKGGRFVVLLLVLCFKPTFLLTLWDVHLKEKVLSCYTSDQELRCKTKICWAVIHDLPPPWPAQNEFHFAASSAALLLKSSFFNHTPCCARALQMAQCMFAFRLLNAEHSWWNNTMIQ